MFKRKTHFSSEEEFSRRRFTEREQLNVNFCKNQKLIMQRYRELVNGGWNRVWDPRTLKYVAAAEVYSKERFASGAAVKNAEILESLINHGVTELNWLGNHVDGSDGERFLTAAETAAEFDDKKHRVDSVVTVRARHGDAWKKIVMALDTTVWTRDSKLRKDLAEVVEREYFAEKISRSDNEPDLYQGDLPLGFTQVDFYRDPWPDNGEELRRLVAVPRFVVGMNGELVDGIFKNDFRTVGGQCVLKGRAEISADSKTAMAGFVVMSEIKLQAEMMLKMLPAEDKTLIGDPLDESALSVGDTRDELALIRDLMQEGLCRQVEAVAKLLRSGGGLPSEVASKIQGASRVTAVRVLEKMLTLPDVGAYDATYAGIVRATKSFTECAESENGATLRRLQPRNKSYKWTGTRVKEIKWE